MQTLITVAKAWAHDDDWSVSTISIATLADLEAALRAGDDPKVLAAHAQHVRDDCLKARCEALIPWLFSRYNRPATAILPAGTRAVLVERREADLG